MSSEGLCQQLKINPNPTHGENRAEREQELCVASGEGSELHVLMELGAGGDGARVGHSTA